MDDERIGIEVSVVRCPKSMHVELIFESDISLDSESFYDVLRHFVEAWESNPDQIFKYHDQSFPHRRLKEH